MSPKNTPRRLEPSRDCKLCPRLVAFRKSCTENVPLGFNGATPSFGDESAKLLIVGLAPGLQGANRTGRPFTGDDSGLLLFTTLTKFGWTKGTYGGHAKDGFTLVDATITNAVRCVPPKNRPTAAEIRECRPFLLNRIEAMTRLRAILCLGRVAHEATLDALGVARKDATFIHGAQHSVDRPANQQSGLQDEHRGGHQPLVIFDSYHCSRYNTNTKRLTPAMFEEVFDAIGKMLGRK